MPRYLLLALSCLPLLPACSGDADVRPGTGEPGLAPRESEVVLQAVDAGTGAALADEGPVELVRTGGRAARALETFVERGESLETVPAAVDSAITDARSRVEAIRERLRAAGRG